MNVYFGVFSRRRTRQIDFTVRALRQFREPASHSKLKDVVARTSGTARLQRPTAEIEDNINRGRTAFVTAGIAALRGGVPIRVNGEVVGAVGVAGLSMENDIGIANIAAAALSPIPKTAQRR